MSNHLIASKIKSNHPAPNLDNGSPDKLAIVALVFDDISHFRMLSPVQIISELEKTKTIDACAIELVMFNLFAKSPIFVSKYFQLAFAHLINLNRIFGDSIGLNSFG